MESIAYYRINCVVGDIDISNNISEINIVNSINVPYQTFLLTFDIDLKSVSVYDIFGKNDIILSITWTTEDRKPVETTEFTLIALKSNAPIEIHGTIEPSHPTQERVTFVCVTKEPFQFMTTTVNKLFQSNILPIEMIKSIISDFVSSITLNINETNKNNEAYIQYIVPPMSLIDCIRYIDGSDNKIKDMYGEGVGVYNGPLFFQCRHDNVFCMWDLSQQRNIAYKVYQLSQGESDSDIMEETGYGDTFYTQSTINHVGRGTLDTAQTAFENKFLSKPINKLYSWVNLSSEDVFSSNAVAENKTMYHHLNSGDRVNYHTINEIGNEENEAIFKSRIARKISSMSEIEFTLDRNLKIENLLKVGIAIQLKPRVVQYIHFDGNYIVSSSMLTFKKRDTVLWVCNAKIRAFRGDLGI